MKTSQGSIARNIIANTAYSTQNTVHALSFLVNQFTSYPVKKHDCCKIECEVNLLF